MKQRVLIVVLSVVGAMALSSVLQPSAVLAFLLAGVIPGTNLSLPPTIMMLLITIVTISLVVIYLRNNTTLLKRVTKRLSRASKKKAKGSLPHRRFSRI